MDTFKLWQKSFDFVTFFRTKHQEYNNSCVQPQQRFSMPLVLRLFSVILLFGCTSRYKKGLDYEARDNLPIAIEYYAAHLTKNPQDNKARNALSAATQLYEWQLRDESKRLREWEAPVRSMQKLLLLEASSHHMKALNMKFDDVAELEAERSSLVNTARTQLEADLDRRLGRGKVIKSDLRLCRKLNVLLETNDLAGRCSQLHDNLQMKVELDPKRTPYSSQVATALKKKIESVNPEMIGFVRGESDFPNARLEIYISSPKDYVNDWFLTEVNAYHIWVQKRDNKGNPIAKQIVIQPTNSQIKYAEENGLEPPEPTEVTKYVWEEVYGEYRSYKKIKTTTIDYQVKLIDLRKKSEHYVLEGSVTKKSDSEFYDYRGDRRAASHSKGRGANGRSNAPEPKSLASLQVEALNDIADRLSQSIVQRIEE